VSAAALCGGGDVAPLRYDRRTGDDLTKTVAEAIVDLGVAMVAGAGTTVFPKYQCGKPMLGGLPQASRAA